MGIFSDSQQKKTTNIEYLMSSEFMGVFNGFNMCHYKLWTQNSISQNLNCQREQMYLIPYSVLYIEEIKIEHEDKEEFDLGIANLSVLSLS